MEDYIGKLVKRFESGNRGSRALASCCNDWGLSCGTYQLTLRWGNCIKFLKKYFKGEASSLYFNKRMKDFASKEWPGEKYCSSPARVKEVWSECVCSVGEEKFFEYEHEYIEKLYYVPIKKKIKKYINLDRTSRALQECFWSWSVNRGTSGAYTDFMCVVKHINANKVGLDDIFDAIYDNRYEKTTLARYTKCKSPLNSERETLRKYVLVPGISVKKLDSPKYLKTT